MKFNHLSMLFKGTLLSLIIVLLYSCFGVNLFSFNDKDINDILLNGSADDFLSALYKESILSDLANDSTRNKVLDTLNNMIENSGGVEKAKRLMGKASVITKGTSVKKVITTSSFSTLNNIAKEGVELNKRESVGYLTDSLFGGVPEKDLPSTIENLLELSDTLEELGDTLEQDNGGDFPKGYEVDSGEYTEQAIVSGLISVLVDTVNLPRGTDDTQENRISAVANFIASPETSPTTFDGSTPAITLLLGEKDADGNTAGTGTRRVLQAGDMHSLITELENSVKE